MARMPLVTTRTKQGIKTMKGIDIEFMPSSLHCYTVAKNTLERRKELLSKVVYRES